MTANHTTTTTDYDSDKGHIALCTCGWFRMASSSDVSHQRANEHEDRAGSAQDEVAS